MAIDEKKVEKGLKEVNNFLKKLTGGAVGALDAQGAAAVSYQGIRILVKSSPQSNIMIFKNYINFLPAGVSDIQMANLCQFLLRQNDDPANLNAYFAIVRQEGGPDVISVEMRRPITDINYDEFVNGFNSVANVSAKWRSRLQQEFNASPVPYLG